MRNDKKAAANQKRTDFLFVNTLIPFVCQAVMAVLKITTHRILSVLQTFKKLFGLISILSQPR
jgi:predicted ATP-grasp superfamily ATP-dependent carboligase